MTTLLESYRRLAEYNTWMNETLYASCAQLSDEERTRDLGAFFRSVHGTLNHILLADHAWLLRCTRDVERYSPRDRDGNVIKVTGLDQILYRDFSELRAQRVAMDSHIAAWIDSLTDAELQGDVEYAGSRGRWRHPLWWVLTHFFNHQTHHRGQVTTLVKQLGHEPGVTDLIWMMQDRYTKRIDQ
jgi:uncharacterized damage-inducible protein DinB